MSRLAVLAMLVASACGCSSKKSDTPAATNAPPVTPPTPQGSATGTTPAPPPADDPAFHLQPEEGTLTIDKADAKAGTGATVNVKLTPAAGFHIATDFPIKITLTPPDGVKLPKTELTAGGKDKAQGDAATLSEQQLAFGIKATADKPGTYEVKGFFKFGVCDKESCHPKRQPITLQVAAN